MRRRECKFSGEQFFLRMFAFSPSLNRFSMPTIPVERLHNPSEDTLQPCKNLSDSISNPFSLGRKTHLLPAVTIFEFYRRRQIMLLDSDLSFLRQVK